MNKFIVTDHAMHRYVERFENKKKYEHLAHHKNSTNCSICKELSFDLIEEVSKEKKRLDAVIKGELKAASEERSYLNDTCFMDYVYNKYGYDRRFRFLVNDEVLYVALIENGYNVVTTCFPARSSVVGGVVFRPKYKKLQKA